MSYITHIDHQINIYFHWYIFRKPFVSKICIKNKWKCWFTFEVHRIFLVQPEYTRMYPFRHKILENWSEWCDTIGRHHDTSPTRKNIRQFSSQCTVTQGVILPILEIVLKLRHTYHLKILCLIDDILMEYYLELVEC